MDLLYCDGCGVVLCKWALMFPDIYDDDGEVINDNCIWNGEEYIAIVSCPVCAATIREDGE